jgi:hypothetical protein
MVPSPIKPVSLRRTVSDGSEIEVLAVLRGLGFELTLARSMMRINPLLLILDETAAPGVYHPTEQ